MGSTDNKLPRALLGLTVACAEQVNSIGDATVRAHDVGPINMQTSLGSWAELLLPKKVVGAGRRSSSRDLATDSSFLDSAE